MRSVLSVVARARAIMLLSAAATLVGFVVSGLLVSGLLDALVRLPAFMRLMLLLGVASGALLVIRRLVVPALRFRPDPVEMALRIEREHPELRGRLASAVEFERRGMDETSALASRAVEDAAERSRGMRFDSILRYRPALARMAVAAACLAVASGCWLGDPSSSALAMRRLLLPFGSSQWPARTGVESLVKDGSVAALGKPVALRARLTKGDALRERVRAEYRMVRAGETGPWMEVALALQPDGFFERLVDADGEAVEIRFRTGDAETDVVRVRLVKPPFIERAIASIEPPAYAQSALAGRVEDLGDGRDARSTLRDPVLAGSDVVLDLAISRPIRPTDVRDVLTVESAQAAEAGGQDPAQRRVQDAPVPLLEVDQADPTRWKIRLVAREPTRLALKIVDSDGIGLEDPFVFAFDVSPDGAPTATISEPEQDESVVVDAKVPLRADARDDLALRSAGIEIATRIGKDAQESLVFEERASGLAGPGPATSVGTEVMLDLAKLRLSPGDSVTLRAFAEDSFDGPGAVRASEQEPAPTTGHGRVRSAARTLRIVGEEEFERQVRATLAGVRREAVRADERQSRARDAAELDAAAADAAGAQAVVSETLARMREAIEQAAERLQRNARAEGPLAELAQQATDLARMAESRSQEASAALEQAARSQDAASKAEAGKVATERQEEVRAELEDLVSLLDRDEDAWLARRRLDALTNRIRQMARETGQAAARSNGERREELSADARAELDQLAARQRQAAEEAEQLVAELQDRAKALADADPEQSKSLEDAAEAVEDGQVRAEMEQAASEAAENRLSQSKSSQDRAVEALTKAAEALSQDRKVRAQELARALESIVRSIRRLLEQSESRRSELPGVVADAVLREQVAMAVGLLSQNTRGVAADARANGRESARIARFLDAAAGSHAATATALRQDPFVPASATGSIDGAIKSLNDALAAAEEAERRAEERAEDEKREELVARYRDFLERQAAIRTSVQRILPAEGQRLGRRELVESRRIGTIQEELRVAIDALRTNDEDVRGSDALVEMHDIIDSALVDARGRLGEGRPADALPLENEAVETLGAIVAALEDEPEEDDGDPFEEQQGGGGDGQDGAGGADPAGIIPAAAEVRLLKSMQEALARQTRTFDAEASRLDATTRAQRIAELAARQQRILEVGTALAEKIKPGSGAAPMSPSDAGPTVAPEESDADVPEPDSRPDRSDDASDDAEKRESPSGGSRHG